MPSGIYSANQRPRTPEEHTARFWSKVTKSDGCWEWTGLLNQGGYGRFALSASVQIGAHRYSWELHNGAIPEGRLICHHCDNRKCVRPDHLFIGTHHENNADASRKGRLIKHTRRTHCRRGHPLTGKNVRRRYGKRDGRMCVTCTNTTRKAWRDRQ